MQNGGTASIKYQDRLPTGGKDGKMFWFSSFVSGTESFSPVLFKNSLHVEFLHLLEVLTSGVSNTNARRGKKLTHFRTCSGGCPLIFPPVKLLPKKTMRNFRPGGKGDGGRTCSISGNSSYWTYLCSSGNCLPLRPAVSPPSLQRSIRVLSTSKKSRNNLATVCERG